MRFVPPIPIFVRLAAALLLLAGVPALGLVLLPPEYWSFRDAPWSQLFDSADVLVVLAVGVLGHAYLWYQRRRAPRQSRASRLAMVLVWMLATFCVGILWWKASCDPGRADSWLRAAAVALT